MSKATTTSRSGVESPPHGLGATLLRLGPGMIIAGSIVGSGELIATTKVGAEAGFTLLWLVILGCAIKVFCQVELGRYTVTWGRTPLEALNSVPGPRAKVNWIVWAWAVMTLLIVTQQGGIVGGVGQAMSIRLPLTTHGHHFNELQDLWVKQVVEWGQFYRQLPALHETGISPKRIMALDAALSAGTAPDAMAQLEQLRIQRQTLLEPEQEMRFDEFEQNVLALRQQVSHHGKPRDPYYWATLIAVLTSWLLYRGRYGLIQGVALVLVVGFTVVTVLTLAMMQTKPAWAVTGGDLAHGLSFQLPGGDGGGGIRAIGTALAAFGIIGVGAAELIMYPYWCLEKGYAKFTGPREGSAAWIERARGWMRVMRIDAWVSMIVYTLATAAFFLLGAAVLGRSGLDPVDEDMVRVLSEMYVPVFGGEWAPAVFLFGAFAVLYSTFFVAAAGNARMVADGLGLMGVVDHTEAGRMRWSRLISAIWPLVAVTLYWLVKAPAAMVLASGVAQMLMLPLLAVSSLYFRYRRIDDNLKPTPVWDAMLWLSCAAFFVTAGWYLYDKLIR